MSANSGSIIYIPANPRFRVVRRALKADGFNISENLPLRFRASPCRDRHTLAFFFSPPPIPHD